MKTVYVWMTVLICVSFYELSLASDVISLKRTIGSENDTSKDAFSQTCTIRQQQLSPWQTYKSLFDDAEKSPIQKAFLFRPYSPEFRYEITKNGQTILLLAGGSSLKSRDGEAAKALISLMDRRCGSYDTKPSPKSNPSLPNDINRKK